MLTNEKAKLENLLAENQNPKRKLEKTPLLKSELFFYAKQKQNLRFKDDFVFALGCLTVCVTRVWVAGILFESRENSKPENYLKMPQNPTRRVHALLGAG